jgi:hypothetical protein
MAWEEVIVARSMAEGRSLNMIPGGFAGMKFLHEHRLAPRPRMSLAEREAAIIEYARQNPDKVRVPNLILARLWEDDAFYLKVLAGRDDVLSPEQVLAIRRLAEEGMEVGAITDRVGARNVAQVKRVIAGKTYARVS